MILAIIIAILGFGAIIFVHELGHFITARLFKVTVNEFSIGMGPKIFSKKSGKSGILYSLRAIPMGGYVSMAGEDEESFDPNSFDKKSKLARFLILFSGAFMNLALGFVLMFFCVVSSGELASTEVESFYIKDSDGIFIEEYMGLVPGDKIIEINGTDVDTCTSFDYSFTVIRNGNTPCDIKVLRNGETITIKDFSFEFKYANGGTEVSPWFFDPVAKDKTFINIITETWGRTKASVKMVVLSLVDLVSGKHSIDAVSGPVGVVNEIRESTEYGFQSVIFLLSILTLNIGIFNLLPFPALDGGRIVFIAIEAVTGKKINKKIESAINFTGILILFALMIAITFKDIFNLF